MFRKAVASYQAPAPKLASTSKGSSQTDIQKAFKSSQRPGNSKDNRIQASSTPPKEGLTTPLVRGPLNSYKPPPGKDTRLFKALCNENAFQENASPIDVHSAPTNVMPSLHETVQFDIFDYDSESSFAFDDELQLSPETEALLAGSSTGLKSQQSQELPPPQLDIPHSSAPLPWSSSPVPCAKLMAAPKPPIGKASSRETVSHMGNMITNKKFTALRPAQEKLKGEGKPKRQLPWDKSYYAEEPETKKPRARKPKLPHTAFEAPQTNPDMLWNATVSQVKDAQKKLKADIRKKASSPVRGSVKKGSSKATAIKLSEEQLNVIQLAVEGEKSVFFTGSAG